ncbi:NYN domain-containing protein [Sphingomonas sp. HH69]
MNANYFFIDGSALTAQIRHLQRSDPIYRGRYLCPREFTNYFMENLFDLHGGSYKRSTFYFPRGDEAAIEDFIQMPNHKEPGVIRDIHFKFCGRKLKKSAEFNKFVAESVPSKFQSHFSKSEKGIDTEMCCDALRLASRSSLDRLFLFSNDSDFIPLCRTLKDFGSNISIIHLSSSFLANDDLLREADSYDVIPESRLDLMFFPLKLRAEASGGTIDMFDPTEAVQEDAQKPESEKPEADPSDLKLLDDNGVNE